MRHLVFFPLLIVLASAPALAQPPGAKHMRPAASTAATTEGTAATHGPRQHGRPHVYLLRGFMNIFSRGMDALADRLARRGIEATVGNHMEASALAQTAIANCRSGRDSAIMLVGHSFGGSAIVDMANEMQQAGVKVALVATVDPVPHPAPPGPNVRRVVNYYLSGGMGSTVEKGPGFRGSLQNIDMHNYPDLGHSSIAIAEVVQQRLMNDILGALRSSCR
jgi:hypothetical protein